METINNHEGYPDPTAHAAISKISKEEKMIGQLIHIFREIAALVGLEIVGRIVFKDKRSGKIFK